MARRGVLGLALFATAAVCACSDATSSAPHAAFGTRLRVWTPDSAAILANEAISGLQSATQIVVDDSLSWHALWQAIYARHLPPPPAPLIDFTSHSVLVYGLGSLYASLRFDSITYYDLGTVAYLTDTRPGSNCIVPAVVLTPVIAVIAPERVAVRAWLLRDVVHQCS